MQKTKQPTTERVAYTGDIPNTPVRFVWYISQQFRLLALGGILAVLTAAIAEIGAVYAISQLVDNFAEATTKAEQVDILIFWGAVFVVVGIIDRIAWRISGFTGIAWAIKADAVAYRELYAYITKHSHSYFSNRFAGSLSNKISNAAGNSADLIMRSLWDIVPETITVIVTIWLFAAIHPGVGLILFVVLLFVFAFNLWWVRKRRPLVVAYADASSKFRGVGVDLLTNIQATRQYARRRQELRSIDTVLDDRLQKDFKQSYRGEWLMVINGAFSIILTAIILSVVYLMLQANLATAGDLVLVLFLLARIASAFNSIGNMMNGFVRRYGEIEEGLQEVLIDHEITDAPGACRLRANEGRIDWQDVTFEFGENAVFKDFNLAIKPGQRVGLVGHSGAGKTTFVSLLLRQHDLQGGAISIDGQDIAAVRQDSLREAIAVVPQEPMLFHRSIKENIAYGNPKATQKEIEAVAKKAQAHEFINELEHGYETLVGERGVKLSGGQKQRIAIARAMLKDAPILVLDEATSALDSESEVEIQQALHKLMVGKTVIAVAHRLSTLREMDRIIVLDKGKIIEDGSHDALVNYGGIYAKLWDHQAGGFLQD